MPELRPFRGILYDQDRVPLDACVAPPYDVISPERQAELYDRHPANVIRLILGREADRYAEAAAAFGEWQAKGILIRDRVPAIYVVSQRFTLPGGPAAVRNGFIAASKLEDFGKGSVFPHERTLSNPKEDRFRLFQATHAMFSQIFSIYGDEEHIVDRLLEDTMQGRPFADVEQDGVGTRMWRLNDPATTAAIVRGMDGTNVFVADGHHRYETALLYRDALMLRNQAHDGTEAYNYVPMYFTSMDAPGLVVLPTHRVVHGLPRFDPNALLASLAKWFAIGRRQSPEALLLDLPRANGIAFGLVLASGCHLLTLNDSSALQGVPPVLASLDATVLHTLIMARLLGMSDEDQAKKRYLDYANDPQSALLSLREGGAQAVFFMNPTPVRDVRAVAEAGYTMPQKSTFFYPKLLSGTVIYSFAEV